MDSFAAIVVAAGKSSRFGGPLRKTEILIQGMPIWWHALQPFRADTRIKQRIVVAPAEDFQAFCEEFSALIEMAELVVVPGGAERFQSVELGLNAVASDIDWVTVHDGARPCLPNKLVADVLTAALRHEAAIAAVPIVATLKFSERGDYVERTVDRTSLWQAQTPQAYRKALLRRAFNERGDFAATDESQLVERLGVPVFMVSGSPYNLKVTHGDDLVIAQAILQTMASTPADLG